MCLCVILWARWWTAVVDLWRTYGDSSKQQKLFVCGCLRMKKWKKLFKKSFCFWWSGKEVLTPKIYINVKNSPSLTVRLVTQHQSTGPEEPSPQEPSCASSSSSSSSAAAFDLSLLLSSRKRNEAAAQDLCHKCHWSWNVTWVGADVAEQLHLTVFLPSDLSPASAACGTKSRGTSTDTVTSMVEWEHLRY